MRFRSTKTYGHDLGLSACFRQWRADSHCAQLHGYALAFTITFEAEPDERGWVVDFGSLKPLKERLCELFDHRTLVARDDPQRHLFHQLHEAGAANILIVEAVGAEAFASYVMHEAQLLMFQLHGERVHVVSVECREHGANSALVLA